MPDPVPNLDVLGWIAFILLSLVGFRDLPSKQERVAVLMGTFAAAVMAGSKGLVEICLYFFLFPMGLVHLLMGGREDQDVAMGILVGAYAVYLVLFIAYLVTKTVRARLCWGILVAVLLANIGGCHLMIEDTRRNVRSMEFSYAAKRL